MQSRHQRDRQTRSVLNQECMEAHPTTLRSRLRRAGSQRTRYSEHLSAGRSVVATLWRRRTRDTHGTGNPSSRDTHGTRSREERHKEGEAQPSLLLSIREVARKCGVGWSFATQAWRNGIQALLSEGIKPDRILAAFQICLRDHPDKLAWFVQDFGRWVSAVDGEKRRENQPRCAECGCTPPSHAESCSQVSRRAS